MNDENRNSKRTGLSRVVLILIIVGLVATGIFFLLGQTATARNAAARVRCQNNLKTLYPLILQHVATRGQFPVNEGHHFSISQLCENDENYQRLMKSLTACEGEGVDTCYLLGVNVSLDSDGEIDESSRQLLMYDRPGNHLQRLGNGMLERVGGVVQEEAQLLLTDGSVISWCGDTPAYAEWAEQYVDGTGKLYPPGIEQ